MITHYQRLLDYVEPDHVHVLRAASIVESGDKSLAAELEKRGYGTFGEAAAGKPPREPCASTASLTAVIPAKAGTQGSRAQRVPWISAVAGGTGVRRR